MTETDSEQIDRPAEPWTYPYVASAVDFGSNLKVVIRDVDDAAVGYRLVPTLYIANPNRPVMGFLDEFCENHGLHPLIREKGENPTRYQLEITRRDDLHHFLRLIQPYVIARQVPVDVLVEDLLPGLDEGKHSDEEGFLELMGYVDQIREHTHGTGKRKYTQEYFRDEFGL